LPLMADFATDPIKQKKSEAPVKQATLFDATSDEDSALLEAATRLAWRDEDNAK
jgi:hypothetical protein